MQFFDELPLGRTIRDEPVGWEEAKAELIKNPGRWGLVAENVSSSVPSQLRSGKNQFFRGEELESFEFRVRKPENPEVPYGNRRTDLYGRYTKPATKVEGGEQNA